ncbi:MAG TPA: hypothetical protein VGK16_04400 [Candidatus Limnocylindrales bacterium]|jgi:hypothetical protein
MNARIAVSRRTRTVGAAGAGLMAVLLAWSPVLAAISWGTVYTASSDYAYTWGNALTRTVSSAGTAYLHSVFTRYVIGGTAVTDTGPYLGVYYRRGNAGGSSWGTPKRLNASGEHGDYGTIDSSGKYVYATWRRQQHFGSAYDPTQAPRDLQFMRNTYYGSSTAWSARKTDFLGANFIDRPSITAWGSRVYIAYTDSSGGEIRLQRSVDNGATWDYLGAVGATTAQDGDGYSGKPVVVASGSTVAVVFNNGTTARFKLSTNGGDTWSVDTDLAATQYLSLSAAHRSGKFAFAWTTSSRRNLYVKLWNGTSLTSRKTIVSLNDATAYKVLNAPAIALAGSSVIGVAYSACTTTGCSLGSTRGSSIRWIESRNNGSTWSSNKTVASYTASSTRRRNEYPSVVLSSTTRRIIAWTAAGASSSSNARILLRIGTGTP